MKRLLALILVLISIVTCAYAGDALHISNPNPSDRLHLRVSPSADSLSLGKYYNGAPVERIGSFNHNGWVQVKVGLDGGSLTGYMKREFLSSLKPANAMPQYVAVESFKAYLQPSLSAHQVTVSGGRMLSLIGFSEGWLHIMGHTGTSEGNYTCFVPSDSAVMIALKGGQPVGQPVNVHISNPDPKDRLHLRTAPDQNAKSMGKYYNGTVGTLKSFTEDGQWVQVELYGRTGYMMSKYVTIEGKTNHTYYGIPTVRTVRAAKLYRSADLDGQSKEVGSGMEVDVLGLVDDNTLHVRLRAPQGDTIGYMHWNDTSYTDPK